MTIKLSDVLAAAMALTPEDRLKLVDAIAIIDDWQIDIVDKPEAVAEASQDLLRGVVGVWPQPKKKNHGKPYTTEELSTLQQIIIRADTDMSYTKKERLKDMRRASREFGRDFEAIRNKIQKLRGRP